MDPEGKSPRLSMSMSRRPSTVRGVYDTMREMTNSPPTMASVVIDDRGMSMPFELSAADLEAQQVDLRLRAAAAGNARVAHASDFVLSTVLHARKSDIPRALALADSYLAWRASVRYDDKRELLNDGVRSILRAGVIVVCGPAVTARQGQPVVIVRSGRFAPTKYATLDMARALALAMEYVLRNSPDSAAMRRGVIFVNDMTGFAVWKVDLQLLRFFERAFTRTLPVRVSGIVLANPPLLARMVHAMFGGLLSAKLKARLRLVERGGAAKMAEVFEPSKLPSFFNLGGTFQWTEEMQAEMAEKIISAAESWPPGTTFDETKKP